MSEENLVSKEEIAEFVRDANAAPRDRDWETNLLEWIV